MAEKEGNLGYGRTSEPSKRLWSKTNDEVAAVVVIEKRSLGLAIGRS
jgi:hypothetical protein